MTDPNDLLSYYAPVTTEALDATGAEGGADFFKLAPGPNYIRFLPRKVGESNTSPWVRRGQHWMRASKDAKAVGAAACMKVAHGDDADCPACAYAEALLAVPPTEPTYATCQAIAAEMKVKVSFIAAGIVYDAATLQRTGVESLDPSTAAKAIKLIEVGPGVRRELDDLRKNALAGGDFYDPRSGFIVCITKTGTGSLTLTFSQPLTALTLDDFFVRYQSITGAGNITSATGTVTGSTSSSTGGTQVPEPGVIGLLGGALIAMGLVRRRRTVRAAAPAFG